LERRGLLYIIRLKLERWATAAEPGIPPSRSTWEKLRIKKGPRPHPRSKPGTLVVFALSFFCPEHP
jgi:hypothetical protein